VLRPWGSIRPAIAIPLGGATPWSLEASLASQKAAVAKGPLQVKVLVITGGRGGQDHLDNAILRHPGGQALRNSACAPTGRAAKRMAKPTGLEAKNQSTVAGSSTGGFASSAMPSCRLECRSAVGMRTIDWDVPLMASLLDALPPEAACCWW